MSVVPKKNVERITFYTNHIAPWTTNAVAIGTTTTIVGDLDTKTQAAAAALVVQQNAQGAAKAATTALNVAMQAMSDAGASIIDQIRAKARLSGDGVYSLAVLPPPAPPSPKGLPGTPKDFTVTLNNDGSLKLAWECVNPVGSSGTIYQLYRKLPDEADFSYVGGAGSKEYLDMTVPAGTTNIVYKIQAIRSTAAGLWATFNVYFGVGGSGAVTATVQPALKAA